MRLGETPVPIPNTMVKTQEADGTMLETAWESRWLPDYKKDFISDPSTKESFVFEWLITSVRHVPWKLHTNTICIYSEPSRFEGKTMSHACMNEAFWRRSYLASSHIEMKRSRIEMRIWIKSRYLTRHPRWRQIITIISRPIKTNQEEPRNTRDQGAQNAICAAGMYENTILVMVKHVRA